MGKRDKKQRHPDRHSRRGIFKFANDEDEALNDRGDFQRYQLSSPTAEEENDEEIEMEGEDEEEDNVQSSKDMPSKFLLYQQSVQSPKGDISYLQKFFLIYVGGRFPLHLQEDFCGTALLSLDTWPFSNTISGKHFLEGESDLGSTINSVEWLRSDSRRTAVGLDLDLEALKWCMENNFNKIGSDGYSRLSLCNGNVLQPDEAKLVSFEPVELMNKISLENSKVCQEDYAQSSSDEDKSAMVKDDDVSLPRRDIVCAFNYSCCCLHSRADLLVYFKHARNLLSTKGGIFVMDLYGGTSSEQKLRLQRKFPNFTYTWEQAEFDIIGRKTRISLHFHLQKPRKKLRHAFSYSWRLWSLPEIKDCLEEAGFRSIHFWLRQMPDSEEAKSTEGFGVGTDVKYEEIESFDQQDSWNAYIVGVA